MAQYRVIKLHPQRDTDWPFGDIFSDPFWDRWRSGSVDGRYCMNEGSYDNGVRAQCRDQDAATGGA